MLYYKFFFEFLFVLLKCWSACNCKKAKYALTFYTPNVHGAGTDASVNIDVYDSKKPNSPSPSVVISEAENKVDHYLERGTNSTKIATLDVSGDISAIGVTLGSGGDWADWLLEKVEIRQLNESTKLLFICDKKWIRKDMTAKCNKVNGINYKVRAWNRKATSIRANTMYVEVVGANRTTPSHYDYSYPQHERSNVTELWNHSFSIFAEDIGPIIGLVMGIDSKYAPSEWALGEVLISVADSDYWFTSKDVIKKKDKKGDFNVRIAVDSASQTAWSRWSECNTTCVRVSQRQCSIEGGVMNATAALRKQRRERACANAPQIKTETCAKDACPYDDAYKILLGLLICLAVCYTLLVLCGFCYTVYYIVRAVRQYCCGRAHNDPGGPSSTKTESRHSQAIIEPESRNSQPITEPESRDSEARIEHKTSTITKSVELDMLEDSLK